jgi:hypothetical protein
VFVIFGFHRKPERLATIRSMCVACHDRAVQDLCMVRTRFKLFFAPVLPLPRTFRTTCAECGTASIVSAERADLLLSSAPRVDDPEVKRGRVAKGSVAA